MCMRKLKRCANWFSAALGGGYFHFTISLKGVCREIFDTHFFPWFDPIWALIIRLKYFLNTFGFRRDIWSRSSKNSTPWCAWHRRVKTLGSANQNFVLQIFSFVIDVFTPIERISPDCPFKRNQRLSKISILTPRCAEYYGFLSLIIV